MACLTIMYATYETKEFANSELPKAGMLTTLLALEKNAQGSVYTWGRRGRLAVKSIFFSFRIPRFNFQHLPDDCEHTATSVPGYPETSGLHRHQEYI